MNHCEHCNKRIELTDSPFHVVIGRFLICWLCADIFKDPKQLEVWYKNKIKKAS